MRNDRWTTVTESEFQHERRGLEAIRTLLPDNEPWRAWSNFTFTARSGHVREVDLLVVAPGGVYLIELKDWHGSIESRNGSWLQTQPSGVQIPHGNPRHLANKKARELGDLLRRAAPAGPATWVKDAVCFTDASLQLRLSAHDQQGIYTVDTLVDMLKQPPRDDRRRFDAARSRDLASSLEKIGIARSAAEYKVGPYLLERKAFDSGPTWVDYLARHVELSEIARVRIYLRERGSDEKARSSVERAAKREATVLRRFRHPGAVQLKHYDSSGHPSGPALILDYNPRTLRLDEYLAQHGPKLDITGRMALVRQLAETIRSAHGARIYHRALNARAVHVIPRSYNRAAGSESEAASWLSPYLQISDWQLAVQQVDDQGRSGSTEIPSFNTHLTEGADPYLAPELTALNADPVALDVYGLGMLTYLLATGKAPGASQAELSARLEAGQGLRPSAVVDGLSEDIDELVQAATAYRPQHRLATADEFLEMLEVAEQELAGPASDETPAEQPAELDKDPLEAVAGNVLAGRWEVRRRLGTGSTSRAFLVRDLTADSTARRSKMFAVLKVALSDDRADILKREAMIMGRLRADSRIIRLVEAEPLEIGGRTVLVIEYVGDERDDDGVDGTNQEGRHPRRREETVARLLRDDGRLSVDQLESYGDYLFGAVDFLEGEGVWHRDIKPDNIAIRVRPNRTKELVLIDFSLAGFPADQVNAGTEGYLDPFLGTMTRSHYDAHAERYAVAVTLHEMASREMPVWGDGRVSPQQTDPDEHPYPTIATDAFDPAVRDQLTAFFRKALHRDVRKRFPDLKPMRDAWREIFLQLSKTAPSSGRPVDTVEPESTEQLREQAAAAATRDTSIQTSGLSPAAVSFVYDGLRVNTVGELLDLSQRQLVNAPGLGAKTRREVLDRIKKWRERFADQPAAPLTSAGRADAKAELSELETKLSNMLESKVDTSALTLRSLSLDALASLVVPELRKDGANADEAEMVRLLLRLPDERGVLPDIGVWPKQKEVAEALRLSAGSIPKMLKVQRSRWKRQPAIRALRAEILDLVHDMGRVAAAVEIADALILRRGTRLQNREQRRALALAAVRVVVEVEQLDPAKAEFQHAANREAVDESMGAGLLALEVSEGEAPDTPSGPALLDYAQRLGRVADRLAKSETLPTSTTVLSELGAVVPPEGVLAFDERRIVALAAAASRNAAATPRLEIYPRDLSLVRALRLTQAGLVRMVPGMPDGQQPGLTVAEVHERIRARFPEILDDKGGHTLPIGGALTKALRDAGFDLKLGTRDGTKTQRYLPRRTGIESSYLSSGPLDRAFTVHATRYDDNPDLATAVHTTERLVSSARRDGFRVLTVRTGSARRAIRMLGATEGQFDASVVSVAELFLAALHEQVDLRPKPTWETILQADIAPPGSRAAMKFGEYAQTAWGLIEPRISAMLMGEGPLLLVDGGVFARYDAMGVLERLASRARDGGRALWLLCPQSDAARPPRLGKTAVPYQQGLGEWIELPDAWLNVQPHTPVSAMKGSKP